MKRKICLAALIAMGLMFVTFACRGSQKEADTKEALRTEFRKDGVLSIVGADGNVKAEFEIEIADTENSRQTGLKYRENMQDNQAMLFIFDGKQSYGFWMQDTYMPLDMVFADYESNIFFIETHTTPFSEERIEPYGLNMYTLEVKAGICEQYNIKTGDTIKWERTQ